MFSLNVSELCLKVWHQLKRDFMSLCQTKFCVTGNELIPIWLARERILYAA